MSRLTISDIEALRASSGPLSDAVNSYKQFDAFKSSHSLSKRKSKPLDHHFSIESRAFSGASLKKLATPSSKLNTIPLGTGRPTADFYPWESVTVRGQSPLAIVRDGKRHVVEATAQTAIKRGGTYDLASMLDYGHAAGSPELLRFITEHVEIVHNPPYQDWGTCLSCGSTSAMEIALRIFCNRGETILSEEYSYPGFIEVAGLVGVHIQGVKMDASGLRPDSLDKILRNWDVTRGPKPSVLYTIPSGQNPIGVTQSTERKKAIYRLAEEHDLIIIEDDPYYFLQMGPYLDRVENGSSDEESSDEMETFLESLHPSYVSLDRCGRVVRLDSTSKILAPGLRAGWVTASDQIIDKFLSYHEVSTGSVSGPTQLMLFKLLDESWGHQGFLDWLKDLSQQYHTRRDIILRACDNHLPREICNWAVPQHGMFLWININLETHPLLQSTLKAPEMTDLVASQTSNIEERILSHAFSNGVQVTKGFLFDVSKKPKDSIHFRFTFAAAPEPALEAGVKMFAKAVEEEFTSKVVVQ